MVRLLAALAAALSSQAFAADYGAKPPGAPPPSAPEIGFRHHHYKPLPPCNDPAVIATIPEKFAYYDAHVIYSGLAIVNVDGIYENRLRAGGPGLIDRRYCSATAWLSNGQTHEVAYIIEGPKLGFASIGFHVESCLPGFDPYRVYDAWCRSIRP